MSLKARNILATLNLVLEFAIAVVISINISYESIERQQIIDSLGIDVLCNVCVDLEYNEDYKLFYNLSIADAVITFVL